MDCDAERLVLLVSERRPIYDFTIKEHNNRELIDALWEEIAVRMNTSVAHCKLKWCNIRNCYSRYLRTTRNVPSPLTGKRKKKWYLADNLRFLDPFMSQTRKMEQPFEELPLEVIHEFKEDPESSDSQNIQSLPMVVTEFKSEDEVYEPPKKKKLSQSKYTSNEMNFHQFKIRGDPLADPDFDFFKCLFIDFKKLRPRRQRRFKEMMLSTLHSCLDEEEDEQSIQTSSQKDRIQNHSEIVNTSQEEVANSPPYTNNYSDTE
ncbi:uncharacterized protein [Halyomorpha halys]|uniref:uncharacterized protein n=1 Tax=Halyomorpha halys TaxID=286706 RepID=UPI0006D4CFAB|nr:uncharacterized protein LOC106677874 [Halyomorpha halys]